MRNSDVELQQRSIEYLQLSSIATADVLVSGYVYLHHNCSLLTTCVPWVCVGGGCKFISGKWFISHFVWINMLYCVPKYLIVTVSYAYVSTLLSDYMFSSQVCLLYSFNIWFVIQGWMICNHLQKKHWVHINYFLQHEVFVVWYRYYIDLLYDQSYTNSHTKFIGIMFIKEHVF
jgi:hypothetical protein